jgi:hypothetical protein
LSVKPGWVLLCCWAWGNTHAAPLQAFSQEGAPPDAWRVELLPQQKAAATQFEVVRLDDRTVLRVQGERAYGNLVHRLPPGTAAGPLRWRWRLDEGVIRTQSSLHEKAGDDAALKICAFFDLPRSAVPMTERLLLRLAESRTQLKLPSAALCYVFDNSLPPGSLVRNPYTSRVRSIVLGGPMKRWIDEERDLAADFSRAFGEESSAVPALSAIVVAGDSDNTASSTLGYVDALRLTPAR